LEHAVAIERLKSQIRELTEEIETLKKGGKAA
jgi:hypothetical protein